MSKIQELKNKQFELIMKESSIRDKMNIEIDLVKKVYEAKIDSIVAQERTVAKQIKELESSSELITFEESVKYQSIIREARIEYDKMWLLNTFNGSVEIIDVINKCDFYSNQYPAITRQQLEELI